MTEDTKSPHWSLKIPELSGSTSCALLLRPHAPVVFVGANGAGKSRLGAWIAQALSGNAHRISAQRSIQMQDAKTIQGDDEAIHKFQKMDRSTPNSVSNDFHAALMALNAEYNVKAREFYRKIETNPSEPRPPSLRDTAISIWNELLPERRLAVDDLLRYRVSTPAGSEYASGHLSDGERAIFYFITSALLASPGVLIIDEPENHLHRAILAMLFDRLEAMRADCAFVYLTHDLEFAASRSNARAFSVRGYGHPDKWDIEEVPRVSPFSEELVTRIMGSRRPILFVEGDWSSLDVRIFRTVYRNRTVIPVGGCSEVVRAVSSFRRHKSFHHFDVVGIVDDDGRDAVEQRENAERYVFSLPVAEIENLFLVPSVLRAFLRELNFSAEEIEQALLQVREQAFELARNDKGSALASAKLDVDRALKRLELKGQDSAAVEAEIATVLRGMDICGMVASRTRLLEEKINMQDIEGFLRVYSNKGLLSIVARVARQRQEDFVTQFERYLRPPKEELPAALRRVLPQLP